MNDSLFNPDPTPPSPYADWAKRVILWDGILPLLVIGVGPVANVLFPRQEMVATLLAVFIPIAAFFVRMAMGSSYFESHPHRGWQGWVFFTAIVYLVFFDSFMIAMRTEGDIDEGEFWIGFVTLYIPYLAMMALAFFPFRRLISDDADDAFPDASYFETT